MFSPMGVPRTDDADGDLTVARCTLHRLGIPLDTIDTAEQSGGRLCSVQSRSRSDRSGTSPAVFITQQTCQPSHQFSPRQPSCGLAKPEILNLSLPAGQT